MTGQAAAAPVLALLTEFLNPRLGWFGMFAIIATFSLVSALMNLKFFPKNPTPKSILARLERPAPSDL
jgi:predicted MFS family arabinose efflux permease